MDEEEKTHTISVLVENEFGVLARISGMFAARGFNIDALSVAPTTDPQHSRITLITHGNEQIIEQILKQLNRLIDVLKVVDLSSEDCFRLDLMLVKLRAQGKEREKVMDIVEENSGKLLEEFNEKVLTLEFIHEYQVNEAILKKTERI